MEFLNLKQGQMIVIKVSRKFERLCAFLKLDEEGRIRKMLEMFRLAIAIFVGTGGKPITRVECYEKHSV